MNDPVTDDLKNMSSQLENLDGSELWISALGVYPTRKRTEVAAVAVYQNDGTATITPARFVERAESKAGAWQDEMAIDTWETINGDSTAIHRLGERIARAINDMCDRIDTRRLKHSFHHLVKK